jgi:type VI secretion system protein VasG
MLASAKAIISRLDKECVDALQAAVTSVVEKAQAEVTIAHMVLALLERERGDFTVLARDFAVLEQLRDTAEREVRSAPGGHAGRPTFQVRLLDWFEWSFTVSALEMKAQKIHEAALFQQLVTQRELMPGLLATLPAISSDSLTVAVKRCIDPGAEAPGSSAGLTLVERVAALEARLETLEQRMSN